MCDLSLLTSVHTYTQSHRVETCFAFVNLTLDECGGLSVCVLVEKGVYQCILDDTSPPRGGEKLHTPACAAARGGARAAARPFVVCRESEGAFAS